MCLFDALYRKTLCQIVDPLIDRFRGVTELYNFFNVKIFTNRLYKILPLFPQSEHIFLS